MATGTKQRLQESSQFQTFPWVRSCLTVRTGPAHAQHCWKNLLERIERGEIDRSLVVSHRLPLDDAPGAFDMFPKKEDECIKVVLEP